MHYGFLSNERVEVGLPSPAQAGLGLGLGRGRLGSAAAAGGHGGGGAGAMAGAAFRGSLLKRLGLPSALTSVGEKEQRAERVPQQARGRGGSAVGEGGGSGLEADPRTGLPPFRLAQVDRRSVDAAGGGAIDGGVAAAAASAPAQAGAPTVSARDEAEVLCALRVRRDHLAMLQQCTQHSPDLRRCCSAPSSDVEVERAVWRDYARLCAVARQALPPAEDSGADGSAAVVRRSTAGPIPIQEADNINLRVARRYRASVRRLLLAVEARATRHADTL
jgi:hypothetical protein